jgi:hypothetical protein
MSASLVRQLSERIKIDFPQYQLREDELFGWNAATCTITYTTNQKYDAPCLLHELGHAELTHSAYTLDIELLRQESTAWEYAAQVLAPRYGVRIGKAYIQDCLESYRAWLYQRSLCPQCGQTGLQTKQKTYSCINCRSSWRVNDARQCALRRFLV